MAVVNPAVEPETSPMAQPAHLPIRNERLLLWVLAAVQFTNVLDYLIIMPLGPQYMRVFSISPGQFGGLVSAYAIAAGIAGILAGFYLDRLDRKRALLALYAGFTIGTFCCALAPTYHLLLVARLVAGAFGGVNGAVILAIVGDVIPVPRRGAAMGLVMSAFSISSIIGVPVGLFLANRFGWHAPFYMLAGLSAVVWVGADYALPPLNRHLLAGHVHNPVEQMKVLTLHPNHLRAFLFMAVLTCAGFFVFPYISAYMVKNVGLKETELPYIYLVGGGFTIFTMNFVGRLADRFGHRRMYTIMATLSMIPALILVNLPHVSLFLAVATTTFFMVCSSGRMVPAMSLMTASVEHRYRGGFMSLTASVQHFSSGVASFFCGLILDEAKDTGALLHFPIAGVCSVVLAAVTLFLVQRLRPAKDISLPNSFSGSLGEV